MESISASLARQLCIEPHEPLPAYADGGYPLVYIDRDGCELCPDCANADRASVESFNIMYEGSLTHCDECGAEINSAYGDPGADDSAE